MSIDKRNSEGCGCPVDTSAKQKHRPSRQARNYDPTTYEALTRIEKEERTLFAFRPIVYICSPYAGDTEKNIKAAQGYSRFAVDKGYIPIAPHLLFPQFLNDSDPRERELGLFFGNALMSKCAEVWVFGKTVSAGMQREIDRARRKCCRLRYFTENLEEVHDVCDN